jgi:hypothetical protein
MYQSGFAISTIRLVSLNELFVKVADQVTSSDHSDQRFLATRNVAFRASATLRASGYKERCADEGGRGGNKGGLLLLAHEDIEPTVLLCLLLSRS